LLTFSSLKFKLMKYFSRRVLMKNLNLYIDSLKENNIKVLNIGSGGAFGKLINLVNKFDVVNIDFDENKKPDILFDIMSAPLKDNLFHSIFFLEVLEHVKNPFKAIEEIKRLLKPGGELILSVPFVYPEHDIPHDYFRFTKYGIKLLLKDFDIIKIEKRSDFIHTIIILLFRLQMSKYKSDRIIGVFLIAPILFCYPVFYILSKLIKTDYFSSGFFVIAKKRM